MADSSMKHVIAGLIRAVAEPRGRPLCGTKKSQAIFTGNGVAKAAAQHCLSAGLVEIIRSEPRGKKVQEICRITDKGIAYLGAQSQPTPIIDEFKQVLETRSAELTELVRAARDCQHTLVEMKTQMEKVLAGFRPAAAPAVIREEAPTPIPKPMNPLCAWKAEALAFLTQWQVDHATEDCPLPTLFEDAKATVQGLTIGQFHDGLRQLHGQGQIELQPWTGPLSELPEPALALLTGHAVAYYVSRKNS